MSDGLVVYGQCQNCGKVVPQGGEIHTAQRWRPPDHEVRQLCCRCYRYVGGTCERVGPQGQPRLPGSI